MLRRRSAPAFAALGFAALLGIAGTGPAAHGTAIIGIEQVGSNVVATLTGTINTAGLTNVGSLNLGSGIIANEGVVVFAGLTDTVYGGVTGPANFGSGGYASPSSESGSAFEIYGLADALVLSSTYVSGSALNATETFDNTTIAGLGITPGTYIYTFGAGANADSVTIYAGVPASVPEPATFLLAAVGVPALGLWAIRKRKAIAA